MRDGNDQPYISPMMSGTAISPAINTSEKQKANILENHFNSEFVREDPNASKHEPEIYNSHIIRVGSGLRNQIIGDRQINKSQN